MAFRNNGKVGIVHYDGSVSLLAREEVADDAFLFVPDI